MFSSRVMKYLVVNSPEVHREALTSGLARDEGASVTLFATGAQATQYEQ